MAETIPDVILRLARRHIPADAVVPDLPAPIEADTSEPPLDPLAPLPRDTEDESVDASVPAESAQRHLPDAPAHDEPVDGESTPHAVPADMASPESFDVPAGQSHEKTSIEKPPFVVQASRLPSAGQTSAQQQTTIADEPSWATPDTGSFAEFDPAFEQPHAPTASSAARAILPRAAGQPADDSFQPAGRASTSGSNAPDLSSAETVNETSRQLEQTARDLETSLTRLFTTQIETLQRLRDRVDEQERRWVEQQSARRAAL